MVQEVDLDMPTDLKLIIPKGVFNIKDIHVYNPQNTSSTGEACERNCCTPISLEKVFYKHCGLENNYKTNNYYDTYTLLNTTQYKYPILFYDIDKESNTIEFSDNCSSYIKIRIKASGFMGGDINDLKIVPPFVRDAVILRVIEKVCPVMMAHKIDPQLYGGILRATKEELYGKRGLYQASIWEDAIYRLKRADDKEFKDLKMYYSHLNF